MKITYIEKGRQLAFTQSDAAPRIGDKISLNGRVYGVKDAKFTLLPTNVSPEYKVLTCRLEISLWNPKEFTR